MLDEAPAAPAAGSKRGREGDGEGEGQGGEGQGGSKRAKVDADGDDGPICLEGDDDGVIELE